MCDPLSALSAASTVGGFLMNQNAQNNVNSARSAANEAESARQSKIQQEQQQLFGTTLAGQTREATDKKLADATQKRSDAGQAAVVQSNSSAIPLAENVGSEVAQTINDRYAKSANKERGSAALLAKLSGWGDTNADNVLGLQRDGYKQGMLGNFSQASSGILPSELEAANNAGNSQRGIAGLLSGVGTIAGLGGAMGMGGKFSDLFGRSTGGAYNLPAAGRIGPGGRLGGGV